MTACLVKNLAVDLGNRRERNYTALAILNKAFTSCFCIMPCQDMHQDS